MPPKILFVDIETAPNTAYVWGLWEQNISHDHLEQSSYILCWSAKWAGSRGMYYQSVQEQLPKTMLTAIHRLLDEAEIVVHFNGLKFDIPTLNREFIKHGFCPPSPYKQVDLLQVCRKAFRFDSNKLAAVVRDLGIGTKMSKHGFDLWIKCMKGDSKAWSYMCRYNQNDVRILERLYWRLLPWINSHPNLAGDRLACPKCGSAKTQRRGEQVARQQRYARYHCQGCGGWFRGNKVVEKVTGEQGVNIG